MDTDTCKHIKNLKIKPNFKRKEGGKKYAKEYGTIIMELVITYCGH